jgi:hypothetical protein
VEAASYPTQNFEMPFKKFEKFKNKLINFIIFWLKKQNMSTQLNILITVTTIFSFLCVGGMLYLYLYMWNQPEQCAPDVVNGVRYGDVVRIRTANSVSGSTKYIKGATTTVSTESITLQMPPLYMTTNVTQATRFIIRPVDNDLSNRNVVQTSDKFILQLERNQSFYLRYAYETVSNQSENTNIKHWVDVLPETYDGASSQDVNESFKFHLGACSGLLSGAVSQTDIEDWFNTCSAPSLTNAVKYETDYVIKTVYSNLYVDASTPDQINNLETSFQQIEVANIFWQFEKV